MRKLTLGSLFDGSGGFPLAGIICGIEPKWASEVEPFPIRVTSKRIPQMKHLGDISSINGAEIEPVDIITFGSPCTDLSIAGKRAGLDGSQSSLFYEAMRIIKEMRCKTNGEYPRYAVWKMSVEPSPQIKEKTSKVSSRNSVRSRPRKLISLNQQMGKRR
ncbi:DNA cytosine methyltransferase [Paracerasibacillus soli]|uniref:DNA (cytosine-5-)-methyltransferase n=1 Tax=Paracerasibacillus soli TaxID=480284 RepID=A0ABU5CLU3_9BACI|nr:DNA cytosine methyltransferase [Virgibacillus soli]MDY0407332.1 DNA cytosine methyltransferase [Virgibacillus soli]